MARLSIKKDKFYIDDKLTYSEYMPHSGRYLGMLFNQRLIQGVFDDPGHYDKYVRQGLPEFSPETNTDNLIKALPNWYSCGLRAITVGFQGGWPHSVVPADQINNNPFGADGKELDTKYADRMDRIIKAADKIGMIVIVNFLYWAQSLKLNGGGAILNAVRSGARFLKEHGYTNVIIDVANEYNIDKWHQLPCIQNPQSMAMLIQIAKEESGGIPVGCSGGGGMYDAEVVSASDVVLLHGNGLTRDQLYRFLNEVKNLTKGEKPIVINEDSACITRCDVASDIGISWGYYNNYAKQIPPCTYDIEAGEDAFFAEKISRYLGITKPESVSFNSDDFILQGGEGFDVVGAEGTYFFRVAARHPEMIYRIEWFKNGQLSDISYDEPFFYKTENTWISFPWKPDSGDELVARICLADGQVVERKFHKH